MTKGEIVASITKILIVECILHKMSDSVDLKFFSINKNAGIVMQQI